MKSSPKRSMDLLRAAGIRGDALPRRRIRWRDDRRAAVGHVLLDHEGGVHLLPELRREGQLPAGKQRRLLVRGELLADRIAVERSGLLDGGEERVDRLVPERLVPLRDA